MIFRMMSRTELEDYLSKDDLIILPVGSTEQHGPFGLLGTDHLLSEKIAEKVSEITQTIAGPTLPYGMSIHHSEFKGVMTIKTTTIMAVFRDIFWSLDKQGFRRILILNGHGGNRNPFRAMMSELLNDFPELEVKFRCWWEGEGVTELIRKKFGEQEGHHSSPSELSMTMYLFPNDVKKTKTEYRCMIERPVFETAILFKEHFPDGIVGSNANLATNVHGKQLFKKCVEAMAKEIDNW